MSNIVVNSNEKVSVVENFVYAVFSKLDLAPDNGVTLHFGNYGKRVEVPVLGVTGKLQDRAAQFNADGQVLYDSIEIDITAYDLMGEFDAAQAWQYFASNVLTVGGLSVDDADLSADTLSAISTLYLDYTAELHNDLLVLGKSSRPGVFVFSGNYDGFLTKLLVSSATRLRPPHGVFLFNTYAYTASTQELVLEVVPASVPADLRVGDVITVYTDSSSTITGLDFIVSSISGAQIKARPYRLQLTTDESGTTGRAQFINELNIAACLAHLLSAVDSKYLARRDYGFYMSTRLLELYKIAQANNSVSGGFDPRGDKALEYLGRPIYAWSSLPPNFVAIGSPRNFHIAAANSEDFNTLLIRDMKSINLSYTYRVRSSFKTGVELYIDEGLKYIY